MYNLFRVQHETSLDVGGMALNSEYIYLFIYRKKHASDI